MMRNREVYLSMRQCGKTQMWIGYLKEMQKHLGNEDDFIVFIEMFDKSLADKIRKAQEQVND